MYKTFLIITKEKLQPLLTSRKQNKHQTQNTLRNKLSNIFNFQMAFHGLKMFHRLVHNKITQHTQYIHRQVHNKISSQSVIFLLIQGTIFRHNAYALKYISMYQNSKLRLGQLQVRFAGSKNLINAHYTGYITCQKAIYTFIDMNYKQLLQIFNTINNFSDFITILEQYLPYLPIQGPPQKCQKLAIQKKRFQPLKRPLH
eukprot:TRINITY_DN14100_c0_g1_i4.p1 TRINITY_DN14100_c0_g1~~TRINITY_DN14100_c0_g1_i4.p1  ORF type:complete len:200 (+),score=-13.18 TRINITY_DN14100_c0_g1_i4:422-1021(+)